MVRNVLGQIGWIWTIIWGGWVPIWDGSGSDLCGLDQRRADGDDEGDAGLMTLTGVVGATGVTRLTGGTEGVENDVGD